MKQKILLLAGIIFSTVCITYAQADTSNVKRRDAGSAHKKTTTEHMGPENYIMDMIHIKTSDAPSNLKATLQGQEDYNGWEKGNLYKTKNGESYILEMNKNGKKEYHRFGPDGKIMPNPTDN